MREIRTRAELRDVAQELGVRDDWHEPDEQGLTAVVRGNKFDNAGFWPKGLDIPPSTWEDECPSCGATGRDTMGFRSAEGVCGRCGAAPLRRGRVNPGFTVTEKHVVIKRDGQDYAAINLATLLAFACGLEEE